MPGIRADRWNDLVDRFDEAWLWHRSDYREYLDFRFEQADHSFVVLDEAARPVAIVPLRLSHYHALRIIPVKTLRSTGGPAMANDLGAKHRSKALAFVHEHLLALANRLGATDIDMACPPWRPRCAAIGVHARTLSPGSAAAEHGADLGGRFARAEDAIRRAYSSGTRRS